MSKSNYHAEVAIIGAGIAGMCASYYCRLLDISCVVFDAMNCFGGQCSVFYPTKEIYGVPGVVGLSASEFVDILANQSFCSDSFVNEKITKIESGFKLNDVYTANYIIIATGLGDMVPNVPSFVKESHFSSGFVQSNCSDVSLYKGKEVVVAGGGDSAADIAFNIGRIAKKVWVVYRKDAMTCEANKLDKLRSMSNIEIKPSCNLLSVDEHDVITDKGILNADHIVFCYGCKPSRDFVPQISAIGITTQDDRVVVDVSTMQTSVDKIFAIGDVAVYPNKKKNIVSCFFEANKAVKFLKGNYERNKSF